MRIRTGGKRYLAWISAFALVAAAVVFVFVFPWIEVGPAVPGGAPPAGPAQGTAGTPAGGTAATAAASRRAAGIRGSVLTCAGRPAPGAEVRAVLLGPDLWPADPKAPPAAAGSCDGRGRFALESLAPGDYLLEARAADVRGFLPAVTVTGSKPVEVSLRLLEMGSIEGWVEGEDGSAVPGAVVTTDVGGVLRPFYEALGLDRAPPLETLESRTDEAGRFRVGPLPAGQYDLEVRAPGRLRRIVPSVACPVTGVRLELLTSRRARVIVKGREANRVWTEPSSEVTLQKDGTFLLDGLVTGRYRVYAAAFGLAFARGELEISPGREPPVVALRPVREGAVSGSVLAAAGGKRIAGAEVAFFPLDPASVFLPVREEAIRRTRADGNGSYRIGLAPGLWWGAARRAGSRRPWPVFPRWSLPGVGDTVPVSRRRVRHDLRLLRESAVRGTVVRAEDGLPVAGARVLLRGEVSWSASWWTSPAGLPARDSIRRAATTDGGGRFAFDGLVPGRRYRLRVMKGARILVLGKDLGSLGGGTSTARLEVGAEAGTALLRGRVIDEQSRPVPGAYVLVNGLAVRAGVDGRFERTGVPEGVLEIRAFALGYALGPAVRERLLPGEKREMPDLVLRRESVVLAGRVHDAAGRSVPGAVVRVSFGGSGRTYETRTGADGTFEQRGPGVSEAGAVVTVSAVGYAPGRATARLSPLPERVDVELAGLGRIHGRLRRAVGKPTSVAIEFSGKPFPEPLRMRYPAAVEKGLAFVLEGVPPGTFRLRLLAESSAVLDLGERTIPEGGTLDLGDLRLEPGGSVMGRVVTSAGILSPVGIEEQDLWVMPGEDGTFRIDHVPPGTWTLREYGLTKYGAASVPVEVRALRITSVRFHLSR